MTFNLWQLPQFIPDCYFNTHFTCDPVCQLSNKKYIQFTLSLRFLLCGETKYHMSLSIVNDPKCIMSLRADYSLFNSCIPPTLRSLRAILNGQVHVRGSILGALASTLSLMIVYFYYQYLHALEMLLLHTTFILRHQLGRLHSLSDGSHPLEIQML